LQWKKNKKVIGSVGFGFSFSLVLNSIGVRFESTINFRCRHFPFPNKTICCFRTK